MKILLSCDPGHDDAIALLLLGSSPEFDVLGVVAASGNQTIEKTTRNALNVVSYLGLPYKVYRGAPHPIKREVMVCAEIHGESGLDGFDFPPHGRTVEEQGGVEFIVEALLSSSEPVTVVTTGPMTDLALALRKAPAIKKHVDKIVLMGGSIGAGNVTPAAEFNVNCDPEAADICFRSGLPVYMIGLDVTRQVLVTSDVISRMEKINNRASEMFAALMNTYNANQKKVFDLDGGPLHDPLTVAWLLDERLLHFEHVNTEIDLSGGCSYGRTNCDLPDFLHKEKNSYVATEVNVPLFWDIIEKAIQSY